TTAFLFHSCRQPRQPAMPVGRAAVLDVGQVPADRHRHFARPGIGVADTEVVALEHADGRDAGRGAAGEDFGDLAGLHAVDPFGDVDAAFDHLVAAVAQQLDHAGAGDAFEDAAGQLRRGHAAVAPDQEYVHAAQF